MVLRRDAFHSCFYFLPRLQVRLWTYRAWMFAPCCRRTSTTSSGTRAPSPHLLATRASSGLCLTRPSPCRTTRCGRLKVFVYLFLLSLFLKTSDFIRKLFFACFFASRLGSWRALSWTWTTRHCGMTTALLNLSMIVWWSHLSFPVWEKEVRSMSWLSWIPERNFLLPWSYC